MLVVLESVRVLVPFQRKLKECPYKEAEVVVVLSIIRQASDVR
jgi:hypothetical protein